MKTGRTWIRSGTRAAGLAVCLWLAAGASAARADAQSDAVAVVQQVHDAAAGLSRGGSAAQMATLRSAFDGQAIGKTVLGAAWTGASATDRAAFVDALLDAIAAGIAERLAGVPDRSFELLATQILANGDVLVKTRFNRAVRQPVAVDWRLHKCGTSPCIGDVLVDGASVTVQRRDDVMQRLAANGGSVVKLTADLRNEFAAATP